jgi:acyl-coenzyme A synthetase/AMP-(fatty) acid ligase
VDEPINPEAWEWYYPAIAEAAVVGYPHDIKGQDIYAYVTLMVDIEPSDELRKELVNSTLADPSVVDNLIDNRQSR